MSVYSDIAIEFTRQTDGDILKDEDVEAVKNSLMNIVQTVPGSRRMLPTFAQGASSILFEPMDEGTAKRLGSYILDAIKAWEDRIVIERLHVHANEDWNQYESYLVFYIIGTNTPQKLDFIIRRI
jgi:phage baseplate assembly protein W